MKRRAAFRRHIIMIKNRFIRQTALPILAALIWGTAFVAQSVCTPYVPPFAFNAIRSLIAAAVLLPIARAFDRAAVRRGEAPTPSNKRHLWLGGVFCGVFLAAAANLQQAAMADTTAGKAGFITALYMVLVPVLGVFLKKRTSLKTWISVAIAVAGLWLLCFRAGADLKLQTADAYLLLCALFFAGQIHCIDHFGADVDGIRLSCVQFLTTGVISAVLSAAFETFAWSGLLRCVWPILYCALFSSCIAYTLQILALKDADDPTIPSLLFSLESVFSVLAGAVILHDRLSGREYLGCALMLAAVVLAQLPAFRRRKNKLQSP